GPKQDAVLPGTAERGARDREDVRFLRVPAEDRDPELPHAFLHPVREAPEELDVGVGGHREGRDEAEWPRARRRDVAQVHGGRVPADLLRRRPGRDVRLPVHDVGRDDEIVVAPIDNAAVVSQADRLPPVVDAREDVDRAALPDVRELRHGSGIGARDKKAPRLRRLAGPGALRRWVLRLPWSAARPRRVRDDRHEPGDDAGEPEGIAEATYKKSDGADRE